MEISMKKFLSVILVLAISLCGVFALVGCSKNENKNFDMVFITDGGTISDGAYNQSGLLKATTLKLNFRNKNS